MCNTYTWRKWSLVIRGKPILSSETMLYKGYDHNGSVAKKKLWSWSSIGLAPRWPDWW
jgi:hypothetical protein